MLKSFAVKLSMPIPRRTNVASDLNNACFCASLVPGCDDIAHSAIHSSLGSK